MPDESISLSPARPGGPVMVTTLARPHQLALYRKVQAIREPPVVLVRTLALPHPPRAEDRLLLDGERLRLTGVVWDHAAGEFYAVVAQTLIPVDTRASLKALADNGWAKAGFEDCLRRGVTWG